MVRVRLGETMLVMERLSVLLIGVNIMAAEGEYTFGELIEYSDGTVMTKYFVERGR
jgi:hypothetical protein